MPPQTPHVFDQMGKLNIFGTGRVDTVKSTLLNHVHAVTDQNVAVVASNRVAVINAAGVTLRGIFLAVQAVN